jgi:hypothetical protein
MLPSVTFHQETSEPKIPIALRPLTKDASLVTTSNVAPDLNSTISSLVRVTSAASNGVCNRPWLAAQDSCLATISAE